MSSSSSLPSASPRLLMLSPRNTNPPTRSSCSRHSRILRSTHFCLFVVAIILLVPTCSAQQEEEVSFIPCTLCEDDDGATTTTAAMGTFPGGEDCQSWAAPLLRSTPADSPLCADIRVRAFQHCQCPSVTTACRLCGSSNPTTTTYQGIAFPDFIIDGATGFTCGEAEFHAHPDDTGACLDTVAHQWFCGCPDVPRPNPACRVCAAGAKEESDDNDRMAHPNRLLPPPFLITCRQYDRELGLSVPNNESNCTDIYAQAGIDVPGYCGCASATATTTSPCRLCNGQPLPDPDRLAIVNSTTTCADVARATPYITDCAAVDDAYGPVCCSKDADDSTAPTNTEGTAATNGADMTMMSGGGRRRGTILEDLLLASGVWSSLVLGWVCLGLF